MNNYEKEKAEKIRNGMFKTHKATTTDYNGITAIDWRRVGWNTSPRGTESSA